MKMTFKLVCATLCFVSFSVQAAEPPVRVLAPAYVQGALTNLRAQIEVQTGLTLSIETVGTMGITERLEKGEAGDLVVTSKDSLTTPEIKKLVQAQRDVAVSTVAVGVADDARLPNLATQEALADFLKATPSFAYSPGPSGRHMAQVIDKLGLSEAMKPKVTVSPGLLGARVIKGETAAVAQQVSELRLAGLKNIVPLPADLQTRIVVSAATVKGSARASDVKKIVAILASADAAKAYDEAGLLPLK